MPSSPYILESCRGVKPSECPHALPLQADFVLELSRLLAAALLPPGLGGLGRPPRHHERFRLSLCACPNGCARPHVADLGLVAARDMAIATEQCAGCGVCLPACPERAISLPRDKAVLAAERCLGCGACAALCPTRAITAGPVTLRARIGGRLGRRPRLGSEPPRRFSPDTALGLAGRCLTAYARDMRPGLRFSDIVFPNGAPGLPAWVWP